MKECVLVDPLTKVENLFCIGETIRYVCDVAGDLGAIRRSYHFSPIYEEPTSARTQIHAVGFDPEWVELYERKEFRRHDPIPERTLRHGAMLTWSEARRMGTNSKEHEDYFEASSKFGLVHGVGLPLFGPNNRDAYASFDWGRPIEEVPPEHVSMIKALSRAAQMRVCNLLDQDGDDASLSEREAEVLQWLAHGKSRTDIATILDLSPDTVKTYITRIYDKLEARDRIAAVVKGLRLRLIYL
ncbi:MAG: LuxR family transcriptional regulator [Alphaproteobacteria bacterium]|nr:LuxR family transcriptional regulator [Alphaproteobacteria bacterium]